MAGSLIAACALIVLGALPTEVSPLFSGRGRPMPVPAFVLGTTLLLGMSTPAALGAARRWFAEQRRTTIPEDPEPPGLIDRVRAGGPGDSPSPRSVRLRPEIGPRSPPGAVAPPGARPCGAEAEVVASAGQRAEARRLTQAKAMMTRNTNRVMLDAADHRTSEDLILIARISWKESGSLRRS